MTEEMENINRIIHGLAKILETTGTSLSMPETISIMKALGFREREIRPAFWCAATSQNVTVDSANRMSYAATAAPAP